VVTPPAPPSFSKIGNNCGSIVLQDAGSVGFNQGASTFRDPAAALETLTSLASALKKGTEHITLIGSTSSEGGDAVNDPLSLKRANAVKQALVSLHVPVGRITAVGDGSHWSGRVKDIGAGGVLLPGPAEQDRVVVVQLPKCQGTS
jgi:outer membrane protein OmpA-like peptidoglycan-associated protein